MLEHFSDFQGASRGFLSTKRSSLTGSGVSGSTAGKSAQKIGTYTLNSLLGLPNQWAFHPRKSKFFKIRNRFPKGDLNGLPETRWIKRWLARNGKELPIPLDGLPR